MAAAVKCRCVGLFEGRPCGHIRTTIAFGKKPFIQKRNHKFLLVSPAVMSYL